MSGRYAIIEGECVAAMAAMEAESVHAIVTDPPYELAFMGKRWDGTGVAFNVATWEAAYCVLKPGGHLLAFGGTRTFHRLAVAIEDAGFEIRDTISWLYASGFPKSRNIGKDIDRLAGAEREVTGMQRAPGMAKTNVEQGAQGRTTLDFPTYGPAITDAAKEWAGWGTALKPAWEPIIVARKPLIGTVAANVQRYGTGAINVDAGRIEGVPWKAHDATGLATEKFFTRGEAPVIHKEPHAQGRWPPNVALDAEAAADLDAVAGPRQAGNMPANRNGSYFARGGETHGARVPLDGGGASRFFYVAKPSNAERNAGCEDNGHPTVKPITLLRHLVRLVTPPDGIVLDPFAGSGTTGCAALLEGFRFVGIEREAEYCAVAEARVAHWAGKGRQLPLPY